MYRLNKTLLYFFILTLVSSAFAFAIIVRAYEVYAVDYVLRN